MATVVEIRNITAMSVALGDPMGQKAAEDIVRTFLPIENDNDGRVAIIPVNTVGKIWRHKGFDHSRIIESYPILYKTSLFGWSEPEIYRVGHKPHSNMKEYHNYINKFTDGTDEYYIRFTISETRVKTGKVGRNIIHSAAVSYTALYKKGDPSQWIRYIGPGRASTSPFIDKRLQEYFVAYC